MERSGDDAAGTCAADIIESAGEPKFRRKAPGFSRGDISRVLYGGIW